MRNRKYDQLASYQKKALEAALAVLENSYNPYSHFFVGAALIAEDGKIITGTNFENASYGSTICAERAAVLHANALGIKRFKGIAIIGRQKRMPTEMVTAPCGSCRQVLYEVSQISGRDLNVVLSTTRMDKIVLTSVRELLPLAFGPIDVGVELSRYGGRK